MSADLTRHHIPIEVEGIKVGVEVERIENDIKLMENRLTDVELRTAKNDGHLFGTDGDGLISQIMAKFDEIITKLDRAAEQRAGMVEKHNKDVNVLGNRVKKCETDINALHDGRRDKAAFKTKIVAGVFIGVSVLSIVGFFTWVIKTITISLGGV